MRRPAPAPPPAPEALAELKRRVIARTGHFYYSDKEDLLWERAQRRMRARGETSLADYLARLEREAEEWPALEAELTIGETFFFRYAEQFAALRETILPAIFAARAEQRRVRILSAGCATGAEPYSLAILIDELLGEARADWRISILGVDINETFLAQAHQAEFGRWATRTLTDAERGAWFTPGPGPERWTLKRRYRNAVRFQRLNLMDLLGPGAPLEFTDFDLILCRNVLIYFHPDTVLAVAQALVERLSPEGWLLVGHAEPNPGFNRFARATSLPGATGYRPLDAAALDGPEPPPLAAPPPAERFHVLAERAAAWEPAPLPAAARSNVAPIAQPPEAPPDADADLLPQIRARADAGDLAGALSLTEAALARAPADPALRYYEGVLARGLGRLPAAEAALKKAVYLDGGFVMAHLQLGLVRIDRGQAETGRRAIGFAAKLAGTISPATPLPEGAGMTAQDVRDLARLYLDSQDTSRGPHG